MASPPAPLSPSTTSGSSSGFREQPNAHSVTVSEATEVHQTPMLASILMRQRPTLWLDEQNGLRQIIEKKGRLRLFEARKTEIYGSIFSFSPEGFFGTPFSCFDFITAFCTGQTMHGNMKTRCIYWLYMDNVRDGKADFRLNIHHPLDPPPEDPLNPFISLPLNCLYRTSGQKPMRVMQLDHFDQLLKPSTIPDISAIQMPNTVSLPMSPQPAAPFALNLYDYQRRTLGWMENVEDGDDSVYYNPNMTMVDENTFFDRLSHGYPTSRSLLGCLYSLEEAKLKAPSVKSGIIADKPGVGKTITTLALCQTRPYKDEEFLYSLDPVTQRFKSKATVIFVPNNIASQWMTEIKKCFGTNINAIEIKGKRGYEATTLRQILECDIVIVSYNFLTNVNYIAGKITSKSRRLNTHAPEIDFSVKATAKEFIDNLPVGKYAFSWIHFHRVVFDEFHEITDKHRAIKTQLEIMEGDIMWGLTGTPKVDNQYTVATFATYLNINLSNLWHSLPWPLSSTSGTMIACKEFLINRVRRNEPEIHYPPPIYETIRVTQTAMEMSLYRSSATNDNRANMENLVKLCNHYQIGNNLFSETGSEALTIEQVTQRVQTDRSTKINQLTKQIENQIKVIERRREVLNKAVDYQVRQAAELSYRKALTEDRQMKEELRSTQSQFNFFQNFLNSYGSEDNKIFCSVCWDDDIPKDGLALVPCGHVFCWECAEGVANRNQKCPQCMMPIRRDQLMKLQPPTAALEAPEPSAEQKENDDGDKLDPDKFGSKIRELVEYLQREMAENDNNRFLVFIQWSDLADLVSQALNTFGIATARLKSGWTQREAALKQFRAGLPESSFVKDDKIEDEAEAETKAEVDEEKMEEIAELKPKAMKTKAVKKDVKGKGRAVPLDSDLGEVQPLPPRRATRKAKATAIIESESDEPEPKEDVVEIKKGARRATSSKTRPAKKQRKKADDSEDDFGVGSDDEDVREDDEFDESAVVAKPSKKRPALNEVESKSMKREQKYKAVKVLMLSAKDSVSGLNLTEATHCIIMHPFHDNKEDYAIGAEKQGVARTLRNGQTKTVKIVRFVVERTVEQEMHDRRVDKLKD